MADPGEDGAIAAARYFLEVYDYAYNTWDLSQWNAISDPGCVFCQSVSDQVGQIQADGQYVERGPTTFHDIAVEPPNVKHAHYIVTINATQGIRKSYGPNRELANEASAKRQILRIAVLRAGDGWVLNGINATAVESNAP